MLPMRSPHQRSSQQAASCAGQPPPEPPGTAEGKSHWAREQPWFAFAEAPHPKRAALGRIVLGPATSSRPGLSIEEFAQQQKRLGPQSRTRSLSAAAWLLVLSSSWPES